MGSVAKKPTGPKATPAVEASVPSVLDWFKQHASEKTRVGLARFAIPSEHALGVTVRDLRLLAKQLGRNHALAAALWQTGIYEARMLTAFIDEPARVTPAQMDRWSRDFDNWAICDTLCFALFDRTPHAWAKVAQWSKRSNEFEKRAAFALLWALAAHDKTRRRKALPRRPPPHRSRRHRRPQLRQESRQHGPAHDRQTQRLPE